MNIDFTMNITDDKYNGHYENDTSENVLRLFNKEFENNSNPDKTLKSILNKAQKDLEKNETSKSLEKIKKYEELLKNLEEQITNISEDEKQLKTKCDNIKLCMEKIYKLDKPLYFSLANFFINSQINCSSNVFKYKKGNTLSISTKGCDAELKKYLIINTLKEIISNEDYSTTQHKNLYKMINEFAKIYLSAYTVEKEELNIFLKLFKNNSKNNDVNIFLKLFKNNSKNNDVNNILSLFNNYLKYYSLNDMKNEKGDYDFFEEELKNYKLDYGALLNFKAELKPEELEKIIKKEEETKNILPPNAETLKFLIKIYTLTHFTNFLRSKNKEFINVIANKVANIKANVDCNIITLEDKQKEILESIVEKLKNTKCVINIEEKINQLKNPIDKTRNDKIKIVNGSNNTSDIYNKSHGLSPKSKKTDTSTDSFIPKNYALKYKNKNKNNNEIIIEFKDSESMQNFKKKFSDLHKNKETKHNRLNTILSQDQSFLLENKILNITCNGRTYKGVNDVWDIENNYSDYNKSHSSSLKSELFVQGGKYYVLNSDLQLLLTAMKEKAKNSQWHDIEFEMQFKIIRNGTEITLRITKDDVLDFISFSTSNYNNENNNENKKIVRSCIINVYKTLSNMQFFLQDTKDKEFIQEQIKNLSDFLKEEEEVEPLAKGIQFIVDDMKNRNTKNDKSNDLIIESIGYINRLLNTTKNYNDLIDKIKILNPDRSDLDIQNSINLLFKNFFETTKKAAEKDLIDQKIFNNYKHVKLIQKFINLFPKEKKESFNKCLKTINIMRNKDCKDRKLYFKKGENKIEIEFCDLESKQDFKNEFSNIKSKIKHGRLNTILQDKNLSLESKILNITCNGRTYKGVSDVWDIENNYSEFSSITPQSLESSLQTQKNKSRCLRIMARKNCPIRRNKY